MYVRNPSLVILVSNYGITLYRLRRRNGPAGNASCPFGPEKRGSWNPFEETLANPVCLKRIRQRRTRSKRCQQQQLNG
jgi:hypothetical protein